MPSGRAAREPDDHDVHWGIRLPGTTAPTVLDGPINGNAFEAYVCQVLVSTLWPGEIVIMNNLPAHRRPPLRTAREAAGAVLRHLPPYSPDFSPIQNAFAKFKALRPAAAACNIDDFWAAIRDALPAFTPTECANYFKAEEYDPD